MIKTRRLVAALPPPCGGFDKNVGYFYNLLFGDTCVELTATFSYQITLAFYQILANASLTQQVEILKFFYLFSPRSCCKKSPKNILFLNHMQIGLENMAKNSDGKTRMQNHFPFAKTNLNENVPCMECSFLLEIESEKSAVFLLLQHKLR